MKSWDEVKQEFDIDGSLRDIYIENTDSIYWDKFLSYLKSTNYVTRFMHGEAEIAIPVCFSEIKNLQQSEPTILTIYLSDSLALKCHFFVEYEIELDLSPSEIQSDIEYKQLVEFLKILSECLSKQVKVTHEGSSDDVILKISVISV